MATAKKKITSWSFSRYSDYRQCPLKAKIKYIDKISEPSNDAMARGSKIHEKVEDYIKGKIVRLPKELKLVTDKLKMLKAMFKKITSRMYVEETWAFTSKWTATAWNDWAGCWVRIKLDCAYLLVEDVMIVVDWKTGKFREEMNADYVEQLELYALAALILHPELKEVRPILEYVDQGIIYPPADKPLVYTQKDLTKLKKLWEKRVKPMMNDTVFAPRPNDKCRWCYFGQSGKAKGGPGLCRF
jgi:CRISPR/Cas system-associated exonuclease Cas4 (RecB family)